MPEQITVKFYTPYNVDVGELIKDRFRWNKFRDKIFALPPAFKDILSGVSTAEFFMQIANKHSLTEDGFKNLLRIVRDIILTDIYLGNITNEIKNRLKIDETTAKNIGGLIVSELFAPILGDLKKIHIEKFAKNIPKQQNQNQGADDRIIDLKNQL